MTPEEQKLIRQRSRIFLIRGMKCRFYEFVMALAVWAQEDRVTGRRLCERQIEEEFWATIKNDVIRFYDGVREGRYE